MNADKMTMDFSSMIKRIVFFVILGLLFQLPAYAQQEWDEAELDDVEIEIVKEREITLPKANRNFEKIPPRPSDPVKAPIQYDFRPFSFQTAQINPSIRPLKLKDQSASGIYGGYVSAGYGNYASPYLEGFINSKRDKNKLIGAHAYLNSSAKGPVDGRNSGSGTAGLSLYGKSFSEYVSVSGELAFENRSTHFYGYFPGTDVEPRDIRQSYNQFRVSGELANTKSRDFTYKLGGGFSYLSDRFSAKETEADIDFNSAYKLSEESSIGIRAGYAVITRKDELIEAKPRSLFIVNPTYVFYPVEDLQLSAGVVVAYETDSIDSKDIHVYPDFKASYPLSPSVDVVASLTGGIEKVSLQSMSKENLWIGPDIPIFHTNKLFDLQAALHTRIGNKVAVNGGLSFASLKNWYFYVPGGGPGKFTPEYEQDAVQRTNLFASVGFAQTEAAKFLLRGDLYGYSARDFEEEAWHRPTYKVTGDVSFNIYKKLLVNVNLIAQGGMKAPIFLPNDGVDVVELDAAFDLNARLEYVLSDKFSVFLQGNNITSNKYPVFIRYPVRGFQLLGGLTWSF
jgi:hypothetical protein